ncbi:G-type lectin S-receptor-like serine/threonine-protein kinase [Tanacetum coccineum]
MEGLDLVLLLFCFLFIHKIYAAEFDIISDSQFLTDGDTLVSQTGIFELGFFQPNNSENRYLGIWYKKISVRTVVWLANRDHPLPSASPVMLKIVAPGNLVLFNNMSIIWSSNTTASQNATANLLDSGNLVVTDQELFGNVLWQSFDYPTDTLLPTMRLGKDYSKGIEWRLSSWKSNEDPGPGEFTWEANTHGYPAFELKQRGVLKQRTAPWTNERFTFSGMLSFIVNVFITKTEASYAYHIENNTSILSRLTLNSSGKIVSTVWAEESKTWQRVLEFPNNICDNYNICGAYGSCSTVNMGEKSCACLDEYRFLPRDDDRSGGCVRRTPLDCRNGSEGFIKYSKIKLPDSQNAWFNTSMSLEECEAKCLQNCSCMAYTDTNIIGEGSTGCLMWFNDLIDIRVSTVTGRDIFVRIASSQIGSSNSSSDPAGSSNPTAKKKGGSKTKIILLVLFPGFLLIGFSITLLWYARVKKNKADSMVNGKLLDVSESQEAMELPIFSFSRISNATTRFSLDNKIGEGGFGPVYKGVLEEGLEIAVKRLSRSSSQGVDEFKNEVICISKLQHRNLVKLLGCCIQGDEKLLIYEYMPNGSLDSFIFDKTKGMLLDWTKRFDIIKGISIGLVYLHRDSRLRIIHRDLKASNILLDVHMNPKISDFGMARSFGGNETQANTERVVGTYQMYLALRSVPYWRLSMELIDANLVESCNPSEVSRLIQVGLLCVQNNAGDRPNMPSVIQMLDGEETDEVLQNDDHEEIGEILGFVKVKVKESKEGIGTQQIGNEQNNTKGTPSSNPNNVIPTPVQEFVIFDEEIVTEGSKKWELSACGYFVGYRMSIQELRYHIYRMWSKFRLKHVLNNGNGVFVFKFDNKQGIQSVIESGPWIVNSKPMVVQKWDPSVNLDKKEPTTLPLWIKMMSPPLEAWSNKGMSALASRIGSRLIIDAMTTRMCTQGIGSLGYARMLVEAKVGKVFRHSDSKCPRSKPKEPVHEEAKDGEGFINVGRKKDRKPIRKDVNAGEGLNKENNKEEFSTPIQTQKKIWKVDETVMHDVRNTANKFSVLQDIEDDSLLGIIT